MNLVGKILVVAIFVMSMVWMAFAMAVYVTQKNWKDEVDRPRDQATATLKPGLRFQLEDAKKESVDLKEQLATMQKRIEEVKEAEKQQRAKLETALAEQQTQREALQAEVTELNTKSRDQIAAVTAAQDNLTRLSEQVTKLNADMIAALGDRDAQFTVATNKTIDLHNAYSEVKALKERSLSLAKSIEFYKNKLASLGVKNPDEPVSEGTIAVDGVVTAIQRGDLVEISIGSDDGLKVGSILHVYRAGRAYLGRVQVIETSPDRSAAKILRDSRTGVIQKGDRVATSLKVG
jgi:hypothetical protein